MSNLKYLGYSGVQLLWAKIKYKFVSIIKVNGTTVNATYDENDNKVIDITVPTAAINSISVNNTTVQPDVNKNVNITVPTDTSDLTNNADFQTGAEVTTAINDAIAGITGISFEIVDSLPTTGQQTNVIYLIENSGTATRNIYDEYIWVLQADGVTYDWEKIGTTVADLSNFPDTPIDSTDINTICI